MQKGRIFVFFLCAFSLFLVTFATFLIFKASASQNSESKQKVSAQVAALEIKPSQIPAAHIETKIVIPTSAPNPTPTNSLKQRVSNLNPNDYILGKINEYRASLGLARVSSSPETCSFAQTRAQEISSLETFNHDGFTTRSNSGSLPYPSYKEVTENIAYNTDYKDVVSKWIDSSGHEKNLRGNTPYVCVKNYGDYYAFEGLHP